MPEQVLAKENLAAKLFRFFRETRSELKKVVWPGQKYVTAATILVLVIVVGVAGFVMLVDWFFALAFQALNAVF